MIVHLSEIKVGVAILIGGVDLLPLIISQEVTPIVISPRQVTRGDYSPCINITEATFQNVRNWVTILVTVSRIHADRFGNGSLTVLWRKYDASGTGHITPVTRILVG